MLFIKSAGVIVFKTTDSITGVVELKRERGVCSVLDWHSSALDVS